MSYTEIPGLLMVSLPVRETAKVKTSDLGLTTQIHQYEPGWGEPGTFSAEFKFTDTVFELLDTLHGVKTDYRIIHEDFNIQVDVNAFIHKGPETTYDMSDEHSKVKVEFQSSGAGMVGGESSS